MVINEKVRSKVMKLLQATWNAFESGSKNRINDLEEFTEHAKENVVGIFSDVVISLDLSNPSNSKSINVDAFLDEEVLMSVLVKKLYDPAHIPFFTLEYFQPDLITNDNHEIKYRIVANLTFKKNDVHKLIAYVLDKPQIDVIHDKKLKFINAVYALIHDQVPPCQGTLAAFESLIHATLKAKLYDLVSFDDLPPDKKEVFAMNDTHVWFVQKGQKVYVKKVGYVNLYKIRCLTIGSFLDQLNV